MRCEFTRGEPKLRSQMDLRGTIFCSAKKQTFTIRSCRELSSSKSRRALSTSAQNATQQVLSFAMKSWFQTDYPALVSEAWLEGDGRSPLPRGEKCSLQPNLRAKQLDERSSAPPTSHLQRLIHHNDPHKNSDNHESNVHRIPLLQSTNG